MNGQEQYIATAYVGRQHKGLGPVLSYDQNEAINTSFRKKTISNCITRALLLLSH